MTATAEHYNNTPRCCTVCDRKKVCSVCGNQTTWACADCGIDLRTTVYVCASTACRDAHEKKCPARLLNSYEAYREALRGMVDALNVARGALATAQLLQRGVAEVPENLEAVFTEALARVKELGL